jgi:hypothetical protein
LAAWGTNRALLYPWSYWVRREQIGYLQEPDLDPMKQPWPFFFSLFAMGSIIGSIWLLARGLTFPERSIVDMLREAPRDALLLLAAAGMFSGFLLLLLCWLTTRMGRLSARAPERVDDEVEMDPDAVDACRDPAGQLGDVTAPAASRT